MGVGMVGGAIAGWRHRSGDGEMRRSARGARVGALTATSLICLMGAASAQESADARRTEPRTIMTAQASRLLDFDIPAQPLSSALIAFANQSGYQVSVAHGSLADLQAPRVAGRLTSEEALRRLLAGSGVTWRFQDDNTVVLSKTESGPGVIVLDPVVVEAQRSVPRQAQIGNLPPPYAGGQVATGGSVGIFGNRDVMDTPLSQSSYTSKLAQDQNARTIDDVIKNDPFIRKGSSPGNGVEDFSIRGFTVSGRDFLLNGLPAIAPTNGTAMMVESIERVEVIRGPNALLNGIVPQSAVGGAINVIPKRAGDEPLIQLTPDYSMNSQFGGHIDLGSRFGASQEFGIRFNGVYRDGDTPIDNQSREQKLATLGLDYRGERARFSSDIGYQFDDVTGVRRGLRVSAGLPIPDPPNNKTNFNNPFEYQTTEVAYGTLQGEVDITPSITAFASIGANETLQDFTTANLTINNANGNIAPATVANSAYIFSAVSGSTGFRGTFDTGPIQHQAMIGYGYTWRQWDIHTTPAVTLLSSNFRNPRYTPNGPAFADYGRATKNSDLSFTSYVIGDIMSVMDERLQLMVGVRQQEAHTRRFNSTTGAVTSNYDESAVTPMVGILGKPLQNLSIYANYIEGLQEGGVAPITAANAGDALPPFVAKQYEVGAKWDLGRFAATLAAFQITQRSAGTDPVTNIFEVNGEQRNRGIELNLYGELIEGVRVLTGATYIDSMLTETTNGQNVGNHPQGISPFHLVAGVEWDTPFLKGLTLMGRVTHDSSNYLDVANTQKVPGWTRLDVGARYAFERENGKPIVIRATVTNVLDDDYWVNSSSQLGLSEPLTLRLSTSFNF